MALPLLQYFRLDDEEEPMCNDFVVLAQATVLGNLLDPGYRIIYCRVGRERVLKGAFPCWKAAKDRFLL